MAQVKTACSGLETELEFGEVIFRQEYIAI
jgi:hypothetical protein